MTDILVERDCAIAMRDGTTTRADVWRAAGGRPGPAILVRTPYDKNWMEHQSPIAPGLAVDRGFALVVQDVRGRFASEGSFTPYLQERDDGYDSVEWLAAQDWCDGNVVMSGWSYVGACQWLAAQTAPPPLRAIAPLNSSDCYAEGWTFRNGVLERGLVGSWIAAAIGTTNELRHDNVAQVLGDDAVLGDLLGAARDWLTLPPSDAYWTRVSVSADRHAVRVPALCVGGWYDVLNAATLASHRRSTRSDDRLIVGPWAHDNLFSHLVGDRNLGFAGSGVAFGLGERILDFFDSAIAGAPSQLAPVTVYVLGARRWTTSNSWPPPDASDRAFPLSEGEFAVDPTALPPSLGGRGILVGIPGNGWGPLDQTPLTRRPDVLTSPLAVLSEDTTLAGPAVARLRTAASGGSERHWTVVLCQQADDGRLDVLTEGIAAAPVDAECVDVPLGDLCLEMRAGSRLVALISGGSVPRWQPVTTAGHQRVRAGSHLVVTTARL